VLRDVRVAVHGHGDDEDVDVHHGPRCGDGLCARAEGGGIDGLGPARVGDLDGVAAAPQSAGDGGADRAGADDPDPQGTLFSCMHPPRVHIAISVKVKSTKE
jgi:hypothetical protein